MKKPHPWDDDKYKIKKRIWIHDRIWDRYLKKLERLDKEKIEGWNGQESSDQQYEGNLTE